MADLHSSSPLIWFVDPFEPTPAVERFAFRGSRLAYLGTLGAGAVLLLVSLVGWLIDPHQFFFAYLIAWVFCISVSLGALFFVLIHHITKSHWGIAVRRIPEVLAMSFPLLAVLGIPILFGLHDLFHWTHEGITDPASPHYDEILAGKAAYLNVPFWLVRVALYFIIWTIISRKLYRLSLQQDVAPDPDIPARQRRVSAWAIPVFGVSLAFASYDLLMALDPHWFSTIFGVYFFAGSFFSANALIALLYILLQKRGGMLHGIVTKEHYHDLGKWMLAMTAFWAYIAFSQFMLYWYGGIPEETVFYRHRWEHGWEAHTYSLMFFHFVFPFLIMLIRASKRSTVVMSIMAIWFLFIHFFDLHWVAMPVYALEHHGGHASLSWVSLACWLGMLLVYVGAAFFRMSRHSLVPQHDPRLDMSLHFQNV